MSLSQSDANLLRAEALHDLGKCCGDMRCEWCYEEMLVEYLLEAN